MSRATAKADGSSMMLGGSSGLAGNMFKYKILPFDVQKDFHPVTGLLSLGFAVAVAADYGWKKPRESV